MIVCPDLRGHGRSEGRRGHVSRFENYYLDLESARALGNDNLPSFMLGHSLGGLLVLDYASRVRFVGDYRLPVSPETLEVPTVDAGTEAVVVRCLKDSIWVEVEGVAQPVTLWFPNAFPDSFCKTDLIVPV